MELFDPPNCLNNIISIRLQGVGGLSVSFWKVNCRFSQEPFVYKFCNFECVKSIYVCTITKENNFHI